MVSSSEGRAAQVEGWGTGSKKQTQGKHGETETNKQKKKTRGAGGKLFRARQSTNRFVLLDPFHAGRLRPF